MSARIFFWAVTSSLAGFLFGFDTVVISGAEKTIQSLWGLSDTVHGLTMGTALYGTVLGSLFGGWPTDRLGRKTTLIWIGVLYVLSAIGCGLAWKLHGWWTAGWGPRACCGHEAGNEAATRCNHLRLRCERSLLHPEVQVGMRARAPIPDHARRLRDTTAQGAAAAARLLARRLVVSYAAWLRVISFTALLRVTSFTFRLLVASSANRLLVAGSSSTLRRCSSWRLHSLAERLQNVFGVRIGVL